MDVKIADLKQDIAELDALENQANRQKIKDILSIEKRKLISELSRLEENQSLQATPNASVSKNSHQKYQVKVSNYAWDQSSKYVKFYVTLPKVHTIPSENVKCDFTDKSLELTVADLEDKDYVFKINNLLGKIDPSNSSWKVKTDMVVISCRKIEEVNWSHVTEYEWKASESTKMNFDDKEEKSSDPSESLMTLMKQMYERGDDEMKRTIAKAWTESQEKKQMPL